jgi:sarcosine oxidase
VAVVGRGPFASAAARYLAEAGDDVLLVGPEEPVDWERHRGPFASHYDEGRQAEFAGHNAGLSRLSRSSANAFPALEARTGIRFYREHPNLLVVPRGWRSEYLDLDRCLALARELGEEQIPLDEAALAARFPTLRFDPGSRGLLEPRGGIINPRQLVRAQLAAARERGATLVADEVVALRRRPGEIELATRGGQALRADRALVATGGFTNAARLLGRRLALHLSGVTVVLVEAPREPRPEIPSVTFVLRSDAGPRVGFAMPPLRYPDGRWYLKCATGSSVDVVLSDDELGPWYRGPGLREDAALVLGLLRDVLPGFEPGRVRTAPCMVAYTPSGLPYIDRVEERVGIAAGCNAVGVMTSDAIGRLAAATVGDAPWPGPLGPELFRARFA